MKFAGQLSFLSPELSKWDQLKDPPQLLALSLFSDERPLRGASGLCDFRLCGRLSRLLASGKVTGEFGESTLYPLGYRLDFQRVLLFGLGESARFNETRAKSATERLLSIAARLGVSRWALVLPGRSLGALSARRALELFIEQLKKQPLRHDHLVIIEALAGQKEASGVLESFAAH